MFAALRRLMRSPGFKFFLVLFLVLLISIPLYLAGVAVDERATRARDVREEVGRLWGPSQRLMGPFVIVPYTVRVSAIENDKTVERVVEQRAVFTPDLSKVDGRADAQFLHRSIYDVPVYTAHLRLTGRFGPLRIGDVEPSAVELVRWSDAIFALTLSGVAGLKSETAVKLNGAADLSFSPSVGLPGEAPDGIHARLPPATGAAFDPQTPFDFDVALDFNGSVGLSVAPVAKQTQMSLQSNWSTPSFGDAFLPSDRTVDGSGFRARWEIPHLARSVPESWRLQEGAGLDRFAPYAFGVQFVDPIDFYALVNRAMKYAMMFVAMTFMAVFCFELVLKRRVHAVQYLFTGVALVFFYVLLLSFAEHIGFDPAYALASAATGGMLAAYVGAVLRSLVQGLTMAAVLATLFGLLYFILQLEDYALLAGSLLGFAALTATMFATLRVDWSGGAEEESRRQRPERRCGPGRPSGAPCLVGDASEALLAAEHRQHVENAGRGRTASQRRAQRLGDRSELRPFGVGVGAHRRFGFRRAPVLDRGEPRQQRLEMQTAAARQDLRGLVVDRQRPPREHEVRAVGEFDQRLGALLEAGQGGAQLRALARVELGGDRRAARQEGQGVDQDRHQFVVGRRPHVMAVHVLELGGVEARRRAADRRQVERLDQRLGREELAVALAPAEPSQIIAQSRRQVAHRAIGVDAERAVALGKLGAVGAVDQRNMGHDRHVPAERRIDLHLARRVGEVVVAADDVGDAHVVVVDHDREHIGRVAVEKFANTEATEEKE